MFGNWHDHLSDSPAAVVIVLLAIYFLARVHFILVHCVRSDQQNVLPNIYGFVLSQGNKFEISIDD